MNWKKVGKLYCLACGVALREADLKSGSKGSIDQCPRCAMVAELIAELIQKQVRAGLRFSRKASSAKAG
jgi:Zn-finger nucleic acid-binding protein